MTAADLILHYLCMWRSMLRARIARWRIQRLIKKLNATGTTCRLPDADTLIERVEKMLRRS